MLIHLSLSGFPRCMFMWILVKGVSACATPYNSTKKIYTHTRLQRKIIFFCLKEGIFLSLNRLIESHGSLNGL